MPSVLILFFFLIHTCATCKVQTQMPADVDLKIVDFNGKNRRKIIGYKNLRESKSTFIV